MLDTRTGKITAANAGHEYPALMPSGGQFDLVKDKHGFVIGGMENQKFREYELQLEPGDMLFLYTDGIPEATNGEGAMFTNEKMLSALNGETDASPQKTIQNVENAVLGFMNEAEQFDDMTMVCLRYNGRSN